MTNNNVQLNNNTTNLRGISLRYSDHANLTCNHVSGLTNGATNGNAAAFYLEKSQGWAVECNHSEDTYTGFEFRSICGSAEGLSANHIETHTIGLHIDPNSLIGLQTHRGNQWTGTYSMVGAWNEGTVDFQNQIIVHTTSGIYHPSTAQTVISPSWFLTQVSGSPWEGCNANCGIFQAKQAEKISSLDSLIAEGGITDSLYQAQMQYSGNRFLYEKLKENPSLLDSSFTMEDFYNSMIGSSIDKFQKIKATYLAQNAYESLKVQLHVNDSLIHNALRQISYNDSLLQIETDSLIIADLQSDNKALYNTIHTISAESQSLSTPAQAATAMQADSLRDKNGQIVDISLYATNERTLNDIYFSTFAKGLYTFSLEQQQQITDIAYQCPYTGGDAVYRARALQFVIDGTLQYDDAATCAAQNVAYRKPSIEKDVIISAWLIPNPTIGIVSLHTSEKVQENTLVTIFDGLGKIVKTVIIPEEADMYSFDTEVLAAGIYYYSLVVREKELIGKLVIAK